MKDLVDSKVLKKQSVSVTDIGTALQVSPSKAWRILRKRLGWYPTNRYIGDLKTTVLVFAESFWLHWLVLGTFVITLPKSAANLAEGSTDWKWTGMEKSEMFYEMSKPNNEKYITVFKYFYSFNGQGSILKKKIQQK